MGKEKEYDQPFIEVIPFGKYKRVESLIDTVFKKESKKVKLNIQNILTNLITSPRIAISRSKNFYQNSDYPSWFSYDSSVKAQKMLSERGLVKIEKGRKSTNPYEKGHSTRLVATETLDNLLEGVIIKPVVADPRHHLTQTLERKAFNPKELGEGFLFPEVIEPLTKEYLIKDRRLVKDLNKNYFSQMVLGFEENSIHPFAGLPFEEAREALIKMSDEEKDAAFMVTNVFFTSMFSCTGNGRLFQRCDKSFQYIPKELRKVLTINGIPTEEVDFTSMQINLAYYIAGVENPYLEDSYGPIASELGQKETGELRDAVKKCVLISLNTNNMKKCSSAFHYQGGKESETLLRLGIKPREVYDAFIKINPALDGMLNDIKEKSAKMMFYESSILKKCINRARKENLMVIPLHDAAICQKGYGEKVKNIMEDEYRKYTGNDIIAKIK